MGVFGFLSLIFYFAAFLFVMIAEELFPGASENSVTSIVFFILLLLGAGFACIQNDEGLEPCIFMEKEETAEAQK